MVVRLVAGFGIRAALPLDEKLAAARNSIEAEAEEAFSNVGIAESWIVDECGRRGLWKRRVWTRVVERQSGDVEHIMDAPLGWKLQSVGRRGDDLCNLVWPGEACLQLVAGASGQRRFARAQHDEVASLECELAAVPVGVLLLPVLGLGDVVLGGPNSGAYLLHIVVGGWGSRSGAADGVQRGQGVLAIVEKERCELGAGRWCVVDGKLSGGEELQPVVLLVVDKVADDLLEGAVGTLGLAVSFWVI